MAKSGKVEVELALELMPKPLPSILAFLLGLGLTSMKAPSAIAAERLDFYYGSFQFTVSVDSLEAFAREGKVNSDLKFIASRLDEARLKQLRGVLQRRFDTDGIYLYRLTRHAPPMVDFLKGMGNFISTHRDRNGFYPLRGAIVSTALEKDSWTIVDVMRAFPTESIWIDATQLSELMPSAAGTNFGERSPNPEP